MTSTPGYASKLDGSLSTLHERFAERGYATSCITANGIVGPASGLTRGCARYRHPGRAWTLQTAPLRLWYALTPSARPALEEQLLTQVTGLRRHATAAEVLGFALADLDLAPAPSYLFLNLMDVHKPYPAAPEISTARTLSFLVDLGGVLVGLREPEDFDRRQATWARRSYHEQVARLDEELGRFFAALREREIYDEALIVVTADHGEAFFDNPDLDLYYDHHGAYEAAVRIPLIVKRPRGSVGRRHARLVELADIAPAVLALAAGEPASGRLFTSGGPAVTEWNPHPVPGAMSTLPLQRIGLYRDGYKLVLEGDWRNTPSTQLFDLEQEPFEAAEVSTSEADVAGRLRDELFGILGREWAAGAANRGGDGEPDPELLETLRSLGYIE
jgi:arylsulfatase A-like enzyme